MTRTIHIMIRMYVQGGNDSNYESFLLCLINNERATRVSFVVAYQLFTPPQPVFRWSGVSHRCIRYILVAQRPWTSHIL
jgi:hypothetical protein